jgi:hypothetical protein
MRQIKEDKMKLLNQCVLGAILCLLLGTAAGVQTNNKSSQAPFKFTVQRAGFEEVSIGLTSLNRNFPSICSFKALTAEIDAENARSALKSLKKGDQVGSLRIFADGDSYPYTYVLRDAIITNVLERKNGTARLSLDYRACEQLRR